MLDKITFIKMNNYKMILILKSISKKERNLYIFINQSINRTNFINYYNNNLHILLFSHFCSRDVEFCSNAAHHQHNAIWWIPSFRPISTVYYYYIKTEISIKHLYFCIQTFAENGHNGYRILPNANKIIFREYSCRSIALLFHTYLFVPLLNIKEFSLMIDTGPGDTQIVCNHSRLFVASMSALHPHTGKLYTQIYIYIYIRSLWKKIPFQTLQQTR